jgi:hypothetical protein
VTIDGSTVRHRAVAGRATEHVGLDSVIGDRLRPDAQRMSAPTISRVAFTLCDADLG